MRRIRTIVKSPGIPFDAPAIQRARAVGAVVLDELELGWRLGSAPIVGVTGTNGKSTVAALIASLLSASGTSVELAGNTEFGPPLSVASVDRDWIVCEVSSYQLEGCPELVPEIAVLTNLSSEHLGRHRTMDIYGQIKRRLFVRNGATVAQAVVGVDDEFGRSLADDLQRRGTHVCRVGISRGSDYRIDAASWGLRNAAIRLRTPGGSVELQTALPGLYNAHNVAAALAAADLLGVKRDISAATIRRFPGVPGRFEHVGAGQQFNVIIDFAHTPDGLEQFLRAVRVGMKREARLIVLLSSFGRPGSAIHQMGRIGRELADRLVLTTSAFCGLAPVPPLEALLRGARETFGERIDVILDRRRAIKHALRMAAPGDVVAIPGRGAMPHLTYDRGRPLEFDDRHVTAEILNQLIGRAEAQRKRIPRPGVPRSDPVANSDPRAVQDAA
jgi:UDP-N-acetylmuramoyl-L-alanyl-D-glutamate--2,6-diaminopimelate ligase